MAQMDPIASDIVEIDLKEAFQKLIKHRQTILSVVIVAMTIAIIYSSMATPIFKTSSHILVDAKRPKITKVDNQILSDNSYDFDFYTSFLNSQVEVLKSHTLAAMVFKDLGGYEPWLRRGKTADKFKPITDEQRIESLLSHIKITPVRMTQVLDISIEDPDPALAAKIVNLWTKTYVLFSSSDQLIQQRSELEDDLDQQSKYLKSKHPVIIGLKNEIDAINKKIDNEWDRLSQPDSNSNLPADITNVKILDLAQVPINPVRPRKELNLALAVFVGLFFGCSLAFLFESLDQTIRKPATIERLLRIPSLVVLPRYEKQKDHKDIPPEFLSFKARHSTIAEAFRSLRTAINFSTPDLTKKTFVITSSSPSEGKTTVAMNLATVFAQSGDKVLIVDTDLRNPRLHNVFGMERINGITDYLTNDKNDLSTYIRKTEITDLDLLTCGEVPPDPSEMLGSKKMAALIVKLSTMYDRIIFDTPPILAATDAVVLSTQVDATLLVIKAGGVHRQAVMRTVEALRSVRAQLLGGILNMTDAGELGKYYYYYVYGENAKKAAGGGKQKSKSRKQIPGSKLT